MDIHTIENRNGMTVRFLPIGGAIVAIEVPDRLGDFANVVLAFADLSAYASQSVYFGVVCGRYANRIGGARFSIDGVGYSAPSDRRNEFGSWRQNRLRQGGLVGRAD